MRVAIIGGGFTGLTAAYELTKQGARVTVFERDKFLGGLAHGFRPARRRGRQKNWDWHLESAYHHLFTNDDAIINLIKELGIGNKLIIKRPITANLLPNAFHPRSENIVQLDSPAHLFDFPGLSLIDKLRTGTLAAFCKLYPFWQSLEGVTAKEFFTKIGGKKAWEIIWEPLMTGKFGHYDGTIAASWLWARIRKRTPRLCYIEGGFQTLVDRLTKGITDLGGKIYTDTSVSSISQSANGKSANLQIYIKNHLSFDICHLAFEKVLITVPTPIVASLVPQLKNHLTEALRIPHLHAQVLILETKEPILERVYWLSVTDRTFPFLAVVAQTNFVDKRHYGGNHITYIGNYLPPGHPYLSMTKEQLLKKFLPYIKHLNPNLTKLNPIRSTLFTGFFAQPVHQLHYSKRAPKLETPIPGVYLANMDSIYPWDRGTNYAVELGTRAANVILQSDKYYQSDQ